MNLNDYDFSGWATKNDIKCYDGRIIRKDAFKENDGKIVPLIWNHSHDDPANVLGQALLKNEDEGVRIYGYFNDTENGQNAKKLVQHGDIKSLSIWANSLKQKGSDVLHGVIREVSLVLAGANPGAVIDTILSHSEFSDEEAIIFIPEDIASIEHSAEGTYIDSDINKIIESMSEPQRKLLYGIVGSMLDIEENNDPEDDIKEKIDTENVENIKAGGTEENMKHNVFEQDENKENVLTHDMITTILKDAKRLGSIKESFLSHAQEYGIENIDFLFPDAKALTKEPELITRNNTWVGRFMKETKHSPFSRIKTLHADLTEDEARAKGYFKGNLKKEEVFALLKRTTTPTTVYKKQKMDRDDQLDITDFDVVSWLKKEMRVMLDEEIARAALLGDGRLASSDEKISELNIRPIYNDEDLFTIKKTVDVASSATAEDKASQLIKAAIKARKQYKGSGNPVMYTTEDWLTEMLLLTDSTGRDLYDSVEKLATKLRVSRIETVEPMEGMNGKDGKPLMAIIVNPADYCFGADKGGNVNMFEDFDIDYNQEKYLIETRCSGALQKAYSAIALTLNATL